MHLDAVDDIMCTEGTGAEAGAAPMVVRGLETAVQWLRDMLQTTVEQYDPTVTELNAANAELQAANEEQRAATDELEISTDAFPATAGCYGGRRFLVSSSSWT